MAAEPTSVLTAEPPRIDPEGAAEIAASTFGVAGAVSPLPSERDQNFRVDAGAAGRWVLKVSNAGELPEVLAMENEAILHAARADPALPVPRLRSALGGGTIASAAGHLVRMVELMPGANVAAADLTPAMLEGFGETLARLGRALRGFFHPAAGRELLWDVKHAASLRPLLPSIADTAERARVEGVVDRWEELVVPRFAALRAQVVHGDLSLDNTLFAPGGDVSGIVDFGDATHTALLCDVAVGLVSVMGGREDALEAGRLLLRGYERVTPLEPLEWEVLPLFVEARLATSVAITAWRLELHPGNAEYIAIDQERYGPLLEAVVEAGPGEVRRRLAGRAATPQQSADLAARRARVFGPALQSLTYERPIHMVRAEGVWMEDAEGRRYLDAYNNVPVVGHNHPRVVDAIARQARLLNTNLRYLTDAPVELAERLLATMPEEIDTCLFVNSGSEANDLAWRIVVEATGGRGGIVTEHAYHGVTTAVTALSPEEWRGLEPAEHVERIPAPDGYRGRYRREEDGWVERYAAHLDDAVAALDARGIRPAAVVVDGAFTSDGILDPPPAYVRELVRRAGAAGARYVADEVQAGYGRLGSHLWSFAADGIVPDVVTLGKPMGNGHPVAAVLMRRELAEAMAERTIYFSTFGGNPVACAAALAVLEVLEEEDVLANAAATGAYLRSRLEELASRAEAIGEVRGRGLMLGVELVRDRATREPAPDLARAVVDGLRERGVLVSRTGREESALKIRPPLVFAREHADLLVERLAEVLGVG